MFQVPGRRADSLRIGRYTNFLDTTPLRYTQAGERHEVTVRIRRNTTGGLGATWTVDKVEESNE